MNSNISNLRRGVKNSNVLFVTFSMWFGGRRMPTNGNVEPFRDFLLSKKVAELTLIDLPVPSSEIVMPVIEYYLGGKRLKKKEKSSWWMYLLLPLLYLFNKHGTRIVFKIRDFLSVIDQSFRTKTKYDYFIGVEFINCLAGIILRRLGMVRKVIYYVLDYSPNRYSNKFINSLYVKFDRFCAEKADHIWDVSKEFQTARSKNGLDLRKSAPVVHVPIGLYPYQIINTAKRIVKHNLVYVGTLGEENGPDLAIKALKLVCQKYKDARLHVIGGGDNNLQRLQRLTKKLGLTNNVIFYGYVPSIRKMVKAISKFDVALAPYLEVEGSIRYFADSGKIRTYAGAGIPIVTTAVPPLGRELAKFGGALMSKDSETEIAKAVGQLFSNRNLYNKMRNKVMEFSRDNTWDNEFGKAFNLMTIKSSKRK